MVKLHYNDLSEQEWIHHLRMNELEEVLKNIPSKDLKILEIGGGDGFIAKSLAKNGYNITSIDPNPRFPQSFPVKQEDGTKMTFLDESFDIVITFHVLQSVNHLKILFEEIARVLKNDGIIIHVVPTSFWVLITSFWHVILLPRNILQSFKKISGAKSNEIKNISKKEVRIKKILKFIFLHPVGVRKSAFHEFIYFRKISWSNTFKESKMEIKKISSGPEIYTGFSIFKKKILNSRKKFVKGPISSSYCFVLTMRKEMK